MENSLSQFEMLLSSPVWTSKQLGRWLTKRQSQAIKHQPDNEKLIKKVFNKCVILIFLIKMSSLARKKIFSIVEFQQESKWMIFLDKLTSSLNPNILALILLKMSVQELILKEKDCQEFWTPAFKEISEQLSSPIRTDFQDLPLNLLNNLFQEQEVKSKYLTIRTTKNLESKNCPKTCCQSYISSTVSKWGPETIKLKTIKIKLNPTLKQKQILNEFIDTSRYVYNRTLEYINNGEELNEFDLQTKLVTADTKSLYTHNKIIKNYIKKISYEKSELNRRVKKLEKMEDKSKKIEIAELKSKIARLGKLIKQEKDDLGVVMKDLPLQKNPLIYDFELVTPKDIRDSAVARCCSAIKSGLTNLQNGNIKFFNMKYKKKTEPRQSIELTKKLISIRNGTVKICPSRFETDKFIKMNGKKNCKKYRNLVINHNCDLVREKNEFWLHVASDLAEEEAVPIENFCGVDPGVRTFATTYNKDGSSTEYLQKQEFLNRLNMKIKSLKLLRGRHVKKKAFNNIEKKKSNFTDHVHWNVINDLLNKNDLVFMGDIKSHGIVKDSNIHWLNQMFNDLKFYKFKQRLQFKSSVKKKIVILVNEAYTSQGCSNCGSLYKIKSSKVYKCKNCLQIFDRDTNSAKNILMKGFLI